MVAVEVSPTFVAGTHIVSQHQVRVIFLYFRFGIVAQAFPLSRVLIDTELFDCFGK